MNSKSFYYLKLIKCLAKVEHFLYLTLIYKETVPLLKKVKGKRTLNN